jgi:uncharacterized protein (TIGR00369 family)
MNNEALNAQLPPYARALGMVISSVIGNFDGAAPIIEMPFGQKVQGRPGFLHGGAISGLLEMAAVAAIHAALKERGSDAPIKQVNVTIDFMRGGLPKTTYAAGSITRLGRTMANVEARAWQDDEGKPIAMAQMHYLIKGKSEG